MGGRRFRLRIGRGAAWHACRLLLALLRRSPRPIWRLPAALLACAFLAADRGVYPLSRALLAACGLPPTPSRRWALAWARCFWHVAYRLLYLQGERITPRWLRRHVRIDGALPPGGAILLTMHHRGARLGLLALAARGHRLATIVPHHRPDELRDLAVDSPRALYRRQGLLLRRRIYDDRIFGRREAAREGLRFLDEGGYLVIAPDVFPLYPHAKEMVALLGRAVAIPRGPVWFARQSGRPIVPLVVVPRGSGWRVRIGEAIPPTQDAVVDALAECIRRAPAGWERPMAMTWLTAPAAPLTAGGAAPCPRASAATPP